MFNPTVLTQASAPPQYAPACLSVVYGSYSNNISSSHAKVIAGAVIGSVFGVIIILLAITATLRKSNFMRKRLGLRWKELNDAEGKDPANLKLPSPASFLSDAPTEPRKDLTSELPRLAPQQVGTEQLEDESLSAPSSTNSIPEASYSITPGDAPSNRGSSRAGAFQQSPPVYSPGARERSPQSPKPSQNSVPTETKSLRSVEGKSRQWV